MRLRQVQQVASAWSVAGLLVSAIAVLAMIGVGSTSSGTKATASAFTPHIGLPPETPVRGYPIILKTPQVSAAVPRQVRAVEQAGRNIVSGGNFHQIELQNGTVVQQKYFAAWNLDTKQMVCAGKFIVDGEVLAIEAGPTPSTVFIGGRFSKIIGADGVGRTRNRVALLNLDTCSVDKKFISTGANNKVDELALFGNRLFVGGDFTTIGGAAVETIAELSAITGAVNPAMNFPTSGELTSRVVGLGVNPTGTRLYIAGRFGTITGSGQTIVAPTAIIDITDPAAPRLTAHMSTGYAIISRLQEASIAQDGSAFGLAFAPGSAHDYVYLTGTAEQTVEFTWRHFMRDSTFAVALSNNAMYVTGHFCYPDAGPGATEILAPKLGIDVCTGTSATGGAWRTHIAALSLTDGTPLAWNPGQDSTVGGRAIAVISRGVLVGSDGERSNGVRVGATAFFDFGTAIEDSAAPSDVVFASPTPGGSLNNPALITGSATDNFRVASYRLSVRNSDGRWVQADGTLATTYHQMTVAPRSDGSLAVELALPAGNYTARALAIDAAGLRSATETIVAFVETGLEGVRPSVTITPPPTPVPSETDAVLTGVATDNVAVRAIIARVRDSAGRYVQIDFSLSTAANAMPVEITAGALESPSADWTVRLGSTLPAGSYNVEVTVVDPSGNSQVVTASFVVVASPPVLTITSPVTTVAFGQPATITATASDNTVSSMRLQFTNSAGEYLQDDGSFSVTANDLNAVFAGIGTGFAFADFVTAVLPAGNYLGVATATDGVGNAATVTQAFVVAAPTQPAGPPAILGVAGQATVAGAFARIQLLATDADGGQITFAVDQLPVGVSLNAATGLISGTPTVVGSLVITATVTDDEGERSSTSFAWTVTPACTVRQDGANVVVDWEPIAGITSFSVRRSGLWLTDVASPVTDYVDVNSTVANPYTVRYRRGGVNVDLACQPM